MPITYVGRVSIYHGRPLWEIVLNLKNFGVGRMVVRKQYERYPEATYHRIIAVEPLRQEYPHNLYGRILTEYTFRGVPVERMYNLGRTAFKPDYMLIPKHEEEAYINSRAKPVPDTKIYPNYMRLPPLWEEFVKIEKSLQNLPVKEDDLRVPIKYSSSVGHKKIRIAQDGETPTFFIENYNHQSPHLYEGIKRTRSPPQSQSASS